MKWHLPKRRVRNETFLFLVCVLLAIIATFYSVRTTVNVTAATESVVIETAERTPRWYFRDVRVSWPGDSEEQPFSGSLQLVAGDRIKVERISTGPIHILISRAPDSSAKAGDAFNSNEVFLRSFGDGTVVRVDNLEARSKEGRNAVFSFQGTLIPGSQTQDVPDMTVPILKTGTILVLGHSLLSESLYRGESVTLGLGDNVIVERPVGPGFGFLMIDETPGLNLTFRQVAKGVRIAHPPARGYVADLSIVDRLKNDRTLQLLWLAAGFLWAIPKSLRKSDVKDLR